jgi:hypothetical protein
LPHPHGLLLLHQRRPDGLPALALSEALAAGVVVEPQPGGEELVGGDERLLGGHIRRPRLEQLIDGGGDQVLVRVELADLGDDGRAGVGRAAGGVQFGDVERLARREVVLAPQQRERADARGGAALLGELVVRHGEARVQLLECRVGRLDGGEGQLVEPGVGGGLGADAGLVLDVALDDHLLLDATALGVLLVVGRGRDGGRGDEEDGGECGESAGAVRG